MEFALKVGELASAALLAERPRRRRRVSGTNFWTIFSVRNRS